MRKGGQVVVIGDGQVSQGSTIVKPDAKKVRRLVSLVLSAAPLSGRESSIEAGAHPPLPLASSRLSSPYHTLQGENGEILAGFAGGTADAFTLLERLERKLEEYPGQLTRAAVELAKAWSEFE